MFQNLLYYITGAYTHLLLFDVCITDQFRQHQLNEIAHPIVPNGEQNKIRAHRKHVCISNITTPAIATVLASETIQSAPQQRLFHIHNSGTNSYSTSFIRLNAVLIRLQNKQTRVESKQKIKRLKTRL